MSRVVAKHKLPRWYQHRVTRRWAELVAFRTRKGRGPQAVQAGEFTLAYRDGKRKVLSGADLRTMWKADPARGVLGARVRG